MVKKVPKISKDDELINALTADLQRIQADFINFKTRADVNRLRDINSGKEQAIEALLPVLDNLDRAISHEPADIKEHSWVKGITQMVKQLDNQLESIGVVKIDQVGEVFDPYKHEAITMEESDGDSEVIAEVLQTGYQFGDTIIRPAKVKVKRIKK
jgi:molecular chaperone GrpE